MKIFYNERQSTTYNESASPSAEKPQIVVNDWTRRNLPVQVVTGFDPVTRQDLYLAHDKNFVNDVLDGREVNGFGNCRPAVNNTLYWTTASLSAACFEAIKTKETICSPTSGFHHAGWAGFNSFGYYCTFNGLIVAAQMLHRAGLIKRIGIVDLDHHDGNGTRDIINHLGLDYIEHYTFGGEHNTFSQQHKIRMPSNYHWRGGIWAEKWLISLPEKLQRFHDCDLIIYQAGADAHKDDPHGGALTSSQMARRDRIVFSAFDEMRIPVVWNLAGGYQRPVDKVIKLHTNTLLECLKVIE